MSDFSTVLVVDSKIADVTPEVVYAVKQGGASNTYQSFKAVSAGSNPSSIVHSIQVPSESVLVSREVVVKSIMTIRSIVDLPQTANAADRFNLNAFSFKAFPFNSSITTAQCNINNTTVSVNLSDIRQILLKLTDINEYHKFSYGSPILVDNYYDYSTNDTTTPNTAISASNVYGNYSTTAAHGLRIGGNRTFKCNTSFQMTAGGVTFGVNTLPPNNELTTAGVIRATAAAVVASITVTWVIETYEPLIGLSPFIWTCNNEYNNAALAGINGLNFNFNIDLTCKDVLITTAADNALLQQTAIANASITNIDSTMIFNFISTQSTQLINAKNVVPYQDFPRYITVSSQAITQEQPTTVISSSSIQINQIPDYFIIVARQQSAKPVPGVSVGRPERYLRINNVSVNFNNSSGLLSSINDPYELWRMSVKNGSQQTYTEFLGEVDFTFSPSVAVVAGAVASQSKKLLLGSILVLDPADLSLPPYLASGSIGQYIFQINLSVTNLTNTTITPEIMIICVNSGVFTTVAGSSSISTALLSKQTVMQTAQGQAVAPMSRSLYNRLVGGSLQNRISSGMRKLYGHKSGGMGGVSSGGSKLSGLDKYC